MIEAGLHEKTLVKYTTQEVFDQLSHPPIRDISSFSHSAILNMFKFCCWNRNTEKSR